MKTTSAHSLVAVLLLTPGVLAWQQSRDASANQVTLTRRYTEGDRLRYRMTGVNEDVKYSAEADGVVEKDAAGNFVEEYTWSNFIVNGAPRTLDPKMTNFRQVVSLTSDKPSAMSNLMQVDPSLIGPITDFYTFYVDLWLVTHGPQFTHAGDHFYHKFGTPASWADGKYVTLGESSIDFDMTLAKVDLTAKIATLVVKHVPPEHPQMHLPAPWMQAPVADTANNWVEVQPVNGKFMASVGKEIFDVQIEVSLDDGKILSATMENPVETIERDCEDAALTDCGEPRHHHIERHVTITLER
jgi:hypothetical protein